MVEGVGVSDEQLDQWENYRLGVGFAGLGMREQRALLGEVRASRAREAELREAFQQASDSADEWCAKEAEWAQAAWDAYGTLGFDRDGDETPAAQVGWGPDSLRAFAADAREEADAGDSEEERLHLEYRRVSKEAREKLRAERDVLQRRIDKALETIADWEHVNDPDNFWARSVRAAVTGAGDQPIEETP